MTDRKQRVVVLGASPNPERYSNKALRLLHKHGHHVIPVHPAATTIEELPVVPSVEQIEGQVDTLTMYVAGSRSSAMTDAIIALNPTRVIFNPGTENPALEAALQARGVRTELACTLILLNTGQF